MEKRLGAPHGLLFCLTILPLGQGGNSPFYSISSFTSFIPTNPGARAGPGISSLFPPLNHNGSPELGVPLPSCIGELAGAKKKKKKKSQAKQKMSQKSLVSM